MPQFIVDTPGGKIPLLPDYFVGREDNCVRLRNYEGIEYAYYED